MKSIHFSIHASHKHLLKPPLLFARHLLGAEPGEGQGDVDVKRNRIQAMSLRDGGRQRVMEEMYVLWHVGGEVGEGVSRQRE